MHVLVANADAAVAASIKLGLDEAGFTVDRVADNPAADAALRRRHYDAVVLTLQVADGAGEALLGALRARTDTTPVLVLMPVCPVTERVRLLDLGADDYLLAPIDVAELCGRLRALIRRSSAAAAPDKLECGPLQLVRHARVAMVNGMRVELTNREFWILDALMRSKNWTMSRRQLEESLYGWCDEVESNAIEVHIHHLRRKLGAGLIQTVRGVGYQLIAGRAAESGSGASIAAPPRDAAPRQAGAHA